MSQTNEIGMSNLSINEAEHEVVEFADDDTHCERRFTLVGKVYTDRIINFQKLQRILMAAWRPRRSVRIQELEGGLFLATFDHLVDMRRVLDDGPWSVERDLVILKPLDEDEQPSNVELSKIPFWIRLINLPFSRRNEMYVRTIAGRLGSVLDVDTRRLKEGSKYIRVRVIIDVSKPLCRHIPVMNRQNEKVMVGLCYERLPNFCYWCGHLGHTFKECLDKPIEVDEKTLEIWPFQESLRAPPLREGISRSDNIFSQGSDYVSTSGGDYVSTSFRPAFINHDKQHSLPSSNNDKRSGVGIDSLKENKTIDETDVNVKQGSMLQNTESNHGNNDKKSYATEGQSGETMAPLKEKENIDTDVKTATNSGTKTKDTFTRNSWKRQARVSSNSCLPTVGVGGSPNEKQANKREWKETVGSEPMEVDGEKRLKNDKCVNEKARAAGQPRLQP
ncbi:hypothetical protein CTI12_AA205220 [Artemisia annua]|uniref:CCHC-type domain-containing protein n=1 Tax=Artemisia annua TaxID=35608 RepID=A0A2U1P1J9_ARTAN|nr:hypothetical protein CTI12_AA205220 [Artemisia annua]